MKISIDSKGRIECNGRQCMMLLAESQPCTDCPLNEIFAKMFIACNPAECKKIKCAGCEYRMLCE